MNRDRQPNRNTRKPYNPPATQSRRTIHNMPTTALPRPSRSPHPAPPPAEETGDKRPFVIGIFIALIILLLGASGLFASYLFKPGNNSSQTLAPAKTPASTSSGTATANGTSCPDPTKQKNIFMKQIPENQALEVYIPQGTTSVVALFSSREDLQCWAGQYNYNQLVSFAIYPKDGQASLIINEEDSSKQNARAQGSWALVIVKGPNALVTVVSLAQAHADVKAWIGSNGIEQANYALTKTSDPSPA